MGFNFPKRLSALRIFLFLVITLGNVWIWRVFRENFLIGLVLVFCSWFFYNSIKFGKFQKLSLVLLFVLLAFQLSKTEVRSLTYLTEGERVIQIRRLNEYPAVGFSIGAKKYWVPLAHWLEQRPETLALYRVQSNLKDVLSPNLYFFANHPNERVGVREHEKFPYIIFPFFVLGLLSLDFKKNRATLSFFILAPVLLVGFAGSYFDVEPVSFFPFIAALSILGIEYARSKVSKLIPTKLRAGAMGVSLILYALVLIQSWLFDKF
jgi:hypothetical protein